MACNSKAPRFPLAAICFFSCISWLTFICSGETTAEVSAANAEVAIAPDAPSAVRFAASEMTNYLSRIFGQVIPLVTTPTDGRYSFVLGTNAWSIVAGLRPEALPRDSYCVQVGKDRAYIAGCDDPKFDPARQLAQGWIGKFERATLFGVYGFLDRHAGVRFYFPGELGTVVPSAKSLRLRCGGYSVTPRFATRDCYLNGAGPYPGIDPEDSKAQRRAKAVYSLLLREETGRIPCCHGQNRFKIAERFSESHPEYFQLRKNGTRCIGTKFEHNWMGRQLCHTSKVWDIFREDTLARIRKGERYVDIMPQDGMSACMCENCQRVFNTDDFSLASGYATELIWSNTVAVAKSITAAGLDGGVSQMAYGTYRNIPSVDIPENVKVVLAVGGPWSESHPDIRDKQIAFIRSWAEKLERPVSWIWTYPMKNYGRLQARDVPQVAPRAFAKFYTLAEPYIDGSFVESNVGESLVQNYLNFYVFSKLAWDGKIDVEQVLAEHHRLMFGAGAPHMARFFDAIERKWIGEIAVPSLIGETEIGPMLYGPNEIDLWQKIYSRAFLDELNRSLQAAAAAVPSGSLEARRIAWIREELYERAARHQKEFMSLLSPDVERARRAADKNARVVVESGADWKGWSLPKKVLRDGTAVGLVADGRLYVGCALRGATALKPNTKYRLSYFLKTDKLERRDAKEGRGGACMEVEQYGKKYSALRMPAATYWNGTRDWIHQSLEFKTNDDVSLPGYKANLWLRVFNSTGTAWFDGVRLEELK